MRKSYKFQKKAKETKDFAFNHKIKAPAVMVIDETGKMLGQMPTSKAIELAIERGYDLMEVAPNDNPPITKFIDYGSFQYQKEKQMRKQRFQSKSLGAKNVRISLNIGEHDKEVKVNQAEKFLSKGHKTTIELILRGREKEHYGLAVSAMKDFIGKITAPFQMESDISKRGNKVFAILIAQ